jgi:hypothetical protein
MSADWSTIRGVLFDWAAAALSPVPVIWAEQNEPPPDGATAYVTLRIAGTAQEGQDAKLPPDAVTGVGEIVGNRDFTLEIQAFGGPVDGSTFGSSLDYISTLRSSLEKPSVRETLRAGNVIYVDTLGSTNITGIVPDTTKYDDRHALDILMRTWSEETDDVGVIEKVQGTTDESGEYSGTHDGVTLKRTLNVDAS